MTNSVTDDALVLVQLRNKFYRKKFHMMLSVFLLSLITIAFLITIVSYLFNHGTRPVYFVANEQGHLIEEVPLNVPFPNEVVTAWVREAVEAANTFNFVNYRSQLQNAQKYFDDFAWSEYMKALTISGNLRTVTIRKEVWSAKVTHPKLLGTQIAKGQYAWKFEMRLQQARIKPDNSTSVQNLIATVYVIRKPLLQSYKGLAILTMTMYEPNSNTAPTLVAPT